MATNRQVVGAYRTARAQARATSTRRLVRLEARARRQLDGQAGVGFARLAALRGELEYRGEEVPPMVNEQP